MKILRRKLALSQDAVSIYAHLCQAGQQAHSALLETCEVGRPEHSQSFIFCSAALKISAQGDDVYIHALNANGKALLADLPTHFYGYTTVDVRSDTIELRYACSEAVQDERERLQSPSILSIVNAIRAELQTRLIAQHANPHELVFFGSISFDIVEHFERLPEVPKEGEDLTFYLADMYVTQNHALHQAKVVTVHFGENADASAQHALQDVLKKLDHLPTLAEQTLATQQADISDISTNIDDARFKDYVDSAKERIVAGDIFQVVLSRQFQLPCADAFASYRVLRKTNPSPYLYFVNFGDRQLFGASPESALKVSPSREVRLYPIAGTRPRGGNAEEDARLEFELIQDEKESAEHMMLVDLARNDIARIVQPQSRRILQLKNIVKYTRVMHIVSEVSGILRENIPSLSAYRACANMGTLTGAPKIEALHIIRDMEKVGRGLYGGAVCVYFGDDSFDSAIIIRSAVVKNGVATVTAGAGIVYDSEPQAEADETRHKARAVLESIQLANQQPSTAPNNGGTA